jgi:hypothetical protein
VAGSNGSNGYPILNGHHLTRPVGRPGASAS